MLIERTISNFLAERKPISVNENGAGYFPVYFRFAIIFLIGWTTTSKVVLHLRRASVHDDIYELKV